MTNYSQFSYDGLWRNTKINETVSGSTTTKQFIVGRSIRCEERDAGGTVTKRYFKNGQTISGNNYFYVRRHDHSVAEMSNASGVVEADYQYEPFGSNLMLIENQVSDFQYAGYYLHTRSSLLLTRMRAYNSKLGRWVSRDPSGESDNTNLFTYCGNEPISNFDPSGLGTLTAPPPTQSPIQTGGGGTGAGGFMRMGPGAFLTILMLWKEWVRRQARENIKKFNEEQSKNRNDCMRPYRKMFLACMCNADKYEKDHPEMKAEAEKLRRKMFRGFGKKSAIL